MRVISISQNAVFRVLDSLAKSICPSPFLGLDHWLYESSSIIHVCLLHVRLTGSYIPFIRSYVQIHVAASRPRPILVFFLESSPFSTLQVVPFSLFLGLLDNIPGATLLKDCTSLCLAQSV